MWTLKNIISEQKEQQQIPKYRQYSDDCQRDGDGALKRGKDSEAQTASYKNSQGDIKCSIGNIAKNVLIIIYGAR